MSNLQYLDEKSVSWKDYPPMSTNRSFHGLVNVGGVLYAIGGKTGMFQFKFLFSIFLKTFFKKLK